MLTATQLLLLSNLIYRDDFFDSDSIGVKMACLVDKNGQAYAVFARTTVPVDLTSIRHYI